MRFLPSSCVFHKGTLVSCITRRVDTESRPISLESRNRPSQDYPVNIFQSKGTILNGAAYAIDGFRAFIDKASNVAGMAAQVQDYGFGAFMREPTADLATTYGAVESFTLPHSKRWLASGPSCRFRSSPWARQRTGS